MILILQIAYMYCLWMGDNVFTAANVGSHFIANNLLLFGFVMLYRQPLGPASCGMG